MNKMLSCTLRLLTSSLAIDTILQRGKFVVQPWLALSHARGVHITSNVTKEFRIGTSKVRAIPVGKGTTLEGESTINVGATAEVTSVFPNVEQLSKLYNGVPYNKLHVINVKASHNNTIMSLTDAEGILIMIHSAGIEGFKNTKKGTNIAAQQTAISFSNRIIEKGFKTVKLRIQGTGPGRMGAVKGFGLSKLDIVSITDDTRVSWNPPRSKKPRKI